MPSVCKRRKLAYSPGQGFTITFVSDGTITLVSLGTAGVTPITGPVGLITFTALTTAKPSTTTLVTPMVFATRSTARSSMASVRT